MISSSWLTSDQFSLRRHFVSCFVYSVCCQKDNKTLLIKTKPSKIPLRFVTVARLWTTKVSKRRSGAELNDQICHVPCRVNVLNKVRCNISRPIATICFYYLSFLVRLLKGLFPLLVVVVVVCRWWRWVSVDGSLFWCTSIWPASFGLCGPDTLFMCGPSCCACFCGPIIKRRHVYYGTISVPPIGRPEIVLFEAPGHF